MKENLKYDIVAGISVFLVAIPLCLGIALASGVPLISGLIAGIVGGIVIGSLSNSHLSVSGPAAGLVAIVLAGIAELGSFPAFMAALVLAGALQISMGLFKAGRLTKYLPSSVIQGMLAAIGIILILKQYPVLMGQNETAAYHTLILGLGICSLILLLLWDSFFAKKFKLIPGSLVVVVLMTLAAFAFNSFSNGSAIEGSYFVQIPAINSLSELKSLLMFPDWGAFSNPLLYKTAVVLALVASIESLLCVNAIERMDPLKRPTDKNRELVAQGTGNILSGLIGGLPITSVIVRSSVNLSAGAKTKASAIIHGVFIIMVLFFGTVLMNQVPLVSLAAILIFTGYKLANPKQFVDTWNSSKIDFTSFVWTIVMVVTIDLLVGVLSGIAVYYLMKKAESTFWEKNAKVSFLKK